MKLSSFLSLAHNDTAEPGMAGQAGRRHGLKGPASTGSAVFADLLRPGARLQELPAARLEGQPATPHAGTVVASPPAGRVAPVDLGHGDPDRFAADREARIGREAGSGGERGEESPGHAQALREPESVGGRATQVAERADTRDSTAPERANHSVAGRAERTHGRRSEESAASADQAGGTTEGVARLHQVPKASVPQSLAGRNTRPRNRAEEVDGRASAGRVLASEHTDRVVASQGAVQPVPSERGRRTSAKSTATAIKGEDVVRQPRALGRSAHQASSVASQAAASGEAAENRTTTQRPLLDPQKWSIYSNRQQSRSGQEGSGREGRQQNRDSRAEVAFRADGARPTARAAAPAELEGGVRDGLNQIVRKAHVLIGKEGETSARIRMNPDHLGFMSVDMKVQNNQVILKILVDREDVLDQLKKDLEILKGDFAKSGLHMESVSLKLRESFDTAFQREADSGLSQSNHDQGAESDGEPGRNSEERRSSRQESAFERTVQTAEHAARPEAGAFSLSGDVPRGDVAAYYDRLLVLNADARDRRVFSA